MKYARSIQVFLFVTAALAACAGASKKELEVANASRADSLSGLRNELLEQMVEGTKFVNEINKELAKARSLGTPQLRPTAEISDVNEERRQVVTRIGQLVTRLENVQSRLNITRTQLADRDSALAAKVADYEAMVVQVNQEAERQRVEFQTVIDGQSTKIVALSKQVDTLTGALGQLTLDHNTVYYVVGTREELIKKGVLVAEGPRRFGLLGAKSVAPARELDPNVFTRIDRLADRTIVLPDGGYKMVSRQNGAYVIPSEFKGGTIAGTLTIEEPERFWSTSRFLILVRS